MCVRAWMDITYGGRFNWRRASDRRRRVLQRGRGVKQLGDRRQREVAQGRGGRRAAAECHDGLRRVGLGFPALVIHAVRRVWYAMRRWRPPG